MLRADTRSVNIAGTSRTAGHDPAVIPSASSWRGGGLGCKILNMQDLYIENWTTGDDDIELRVRGYGVVFCIRFSPETIKAPVLLQQHFNSLHALDTEAGSEVANQLARPFEPLMASLAPEAQDVAGDLLSDYLYPKHFVLEARASAEDTKSTPFFRASITGQDLTLPGGNIRMPQLVNLKLEEWVRNIYSSGQISLAPSNLGDARLSGPKKVLADGNPFFFKSFGKPPGGIYRELDIYKRIKEAMSLGTIGPDLRICHLHGVVIDRDILETSTEQRLLGVLLTFIETNKLSRMGTLFYRVRGGKCTTETLSRWASELDDCITKLHNAGIVWGDASPHNILVNNEGNIWLIDFGGSYTPGWVDKEKCETVEGDLQGIERIKSFLANHSEKANGV
ncbi:hypothetical protein HYALB_00012562 [Hymenoscyphus albidus]|uniref:Protein kinase domain-containing protein n=1 Tax=Hymenoscyphus albidus TaxID=595503 RepID=A0A9N9LWX6_9HELO|nr:hypothetical protein HYALB_00012562 [Hymenoscyphus albidus]